MPNLNRMSSPHLAVMATLAALLLLAWPSLATAQLACGGHHIEWIGGSPGAAVDPFRRNHEPARLPEPEGFDGRDRELWDALVYDAYDHPGSTGQAYHPGPIGEMEMASLPLTERRTIVMHRGEATSFRLCIQSADESYTGRRLERYAGVA